MNPIIALIIANIIWGAASPIFKLSLTNIPPFTLAFIRFFFASFIFLPIAFKKWQAMKTNDLINICLGAFFGITINIAFFFLGLPKTNSINAPVIASAAPVLLFFLSITLFREKPKIKVFNGMMISLLGVLIIIFSPIFLTGKQIAFGEIEGNLFFVIATLGAVLNPLFTKNALKTINPYQVTLIGFFFSSLTFLPFMVLELNQWSFSQLNMNGWLGIIFGIFFSSAIAYFLFNWGIARIKAQEIGIFNYIDPVIAVILAVPLLHEYPDLYFFIGSLLVFAGIYISESRINYHPIHKIKSL